MTRLIAPDIRARIVAPRAARDDLSRAQCGYTVRDMNGVQTRPHGVRAGAVVRWFVVAAALLGLAACGPPTSEEAYISALRHAEPHSASTPDSLLLASGRVVCKIYSEQGAEGVTAMLNGVYAKNGAETGRIMGAISLAATTHLCPKQHT